MPQYEILNKIMVINILKIVITSERAYALI